MTGRDRMGELPLIDIASLLAILQGAFPIRSIMAIRVQSQEPIIVPSYRLRPDTSEALQMAAAMRAYGMVGAAVPEFALAGSASP